MDDIPEVLRESSKSRQMVRLPLALSVIAGLLGFGAIALLLGSVFWRSQSQVVSTPTPPNISATPTPKEVDNVLGHLPYSEASPADLQAITPDGRLRLRKAAAAKFLQMQADARANGIILQPISGFRSVKEQNALFFQVKEQRGQVAAKRAEVSAPPGYSEHHTGYALDIGDGNTPSTHLSQNFEKTAAWRWLKNNAARYSFEMSFSRNNPQGVSYEPWHWRFVGDRASLETFYKARHLP